MSLLRRAIPSRRILSTGPIAQRARQRAWNQVNKRSYASGGHGGEHKDPSDIPWAITSLVVTIPVAGWIWSQGPSRNKHEEGDHHGHDDHSKEDAHDAEEVDSEENKDDAKDVEKEDDKAESEEQPDDSKPEEKAQDKADDAEKDTQKDSEEKSDSDSDSDSESDGKETPASSDDEQSEKEKEMDEYDGPKASTAAMHKGKPHEDKSISKKSEGVHDTAKLTETVDPFRPAK